MTQLTQRLRFNLPDALAGDGKVLADFFERVLAAVWPQTETHLDDLLFARRERLQDLFGNLPQIDIDHGFRRVLNGLVFDEIAEMRILFLADGRFERNRLLGELEYLAHLRGRDVHLLGDLFRRWFAPQFLHQGARGA